MGAIPPTRSNSRSCKNLKLRLEILRNIADLVKEYRPTLRQLDLTLLPPLRAGECSWLVAK